MDEPVYCGRSRGMVFVNVDKEIELKGKLEINDKDFEKLKKKF